jgi:hypothetical protein
VYQLAKAVHFLENDYLKFMACGRLAWQKKGVRVLAAASKLE